MCSHISPSMASSTKRRSGGKPPSGNIGMTAAALQDHLVKSLNLNLNDGAMKKTTRSTPMARKSKLKPQNKKKMGKEKQEEYVIPSSKEEDIRATSLAERMGIIPAPAQSGNRLTEVQWKAVKQRCRERGEMNQPCSICKEFYTPNREQLLLSCSHIFHRKCVGSFEKYSGSHTCPVCRCQDYEKRVVFEAAELTAQYCATLIQCIWRRYTARKMYLKLRESIPPKDERLRKEFYRNKLVNICEQVSQSYAAHEQDVSKLMSSIDESIASNRFVMREFNDKHNNNISNFDWEDVESIAKRREFSDCPICLCAFQKSSSSCRGRDVVLLSCSHLFHVQCLTSYERFVETSDPQCPVCRTVYSKHTMSDGKSNAMFSS